MGGGGEKEWRTVSIFSIVDRGRAGNADVINIPYSAEYCFQRTGGDA